jgi:hypothetical protein
MTVKLFHHTSICIYSNCMDTIYILYVCVCVYIFKEFRTHKIQKTWYFRQKLYLASVEIRHCQKPGTMADEHGTFLLRVITISSTNTGHLSIYKILDILFLQNNSAKPNINICRFSRTHLKQSGVVMWI